VRRNSIAIAMFEPPKSFGRSRGRSASKAIAATESGTR
jgi:hypothetical protein